MVKPPIKELTSVQELAARLDKTPRTITRWLRLNGIPIERMGTENCVWLSDLYARKPQLAESSRLVAELSEGG